MVAADRRRARTMPPRSPLRRVTSALSMRHVGARAHGDADVRGGQRRGVIDAVAGHRHHVPLLTEALDDVAFVLGQDVGLDLGDAELGGHGPRRGGIVARQHHDADARQP